MAIKKKAKKIKKARPAAKKKVVKKKAAMKKAVKKVAKRKITAKASKAAYPALQVIGEVTHFFPHVSAGVMKLSGELKVGDMVHIKGHTTDFKQTVDSMQINHITVSEARKGDEIGLRVKDRVRIGDVVYKL